MIDCSGVRNRSVGEFGLLATCGPSAATGIEVGSISLPCWRQADMGQVPKLLRPRIEVVTSMRIAFVRHKGPESNIEKTFRRFIDWCSDKGLLQDNTKYIGISHEENQAEPRYDLRDHGRPRLSARGGGRGRDNRSRRVRGRHLPGAVLGRRRGLHLADRVLDQAARPAAAARTGLRGLPQRRLHRAGVRTAHRRARSS